jgi:hypothetical protein
MGLTIGGVTFSALRNVPVVSGFQGLILPNVFNARTGMEVSYLARTITFNSVMSPGATQPRVARSGFTISTHASGAQRRKRQRERRAHLPRAPPPSHLQLPASGSSPLNSSRH